MKCKNCNNKLIFVGFGHVKKSTRYYHCLSCRHSFAKNGLFSRIKDLGKEAV